MGSCQSRANHPTRAKVDCESGNTVTRLSCSKNCNNWLEYISIVVSGFARQTLEIPIELEQIITEILTKTGLFLFNICTMDMNLIKDDGRIFQAPNDISNYVNAGDLNGWKRGCCTIKVTKLGGNSLGFGITTAVSNIASNQHIFKWSKRGHTYYTYSDGCGYRSGDYSEKFTNSSWKNGDIIKMEWNQKGHLKFTRHSGDIVYKSKMRIRKGLIYYPGVCRYKGFKSENAEVEIM